MPAIKRKNSASGVVVPKRVSQSSYPQKTEDPVLLVIKAQLSRKDCV